MIEVEAMERLIRRADGSRLHAHRRRRPCKRGGIERIERPVRDVTADFLVDGVVGKSAAAAGGGQGAGDIEGHDARQHDVRTAESHAPHASVRLKHVKAVVGRKVNDVVRVTDFTRKGRPRLERVGRRIVKPDLSNPTLRVAAADHDSARDGIEHGSRVIGPRRLRARNLTVPPGLGVEVVPAGAAAVRRIRPRQVVCLPKGCEEVEASACDHRHVVAVARVWLVGRDPPTEVAVAVAKRHLAARRGWIQRRPLHRLQIKNPNVGFLRGPMTAAEQAHSLAHGVVGDARVVRDVLTTDLA